MRRLALVPCSLVLPLAACFGEGPVPTRADAIQIVYAVPTPPQGQECSSSMYVGDVGIGVDTGYTVALPYQPQNNCGGGSGPPQIALTVTTFDLAGSTPNGAVLGGGGAGQSNNPPRFAFSDRPVWAFTPQGGNNLTLGPSQTSLQPGPTFMGGNTVGVHADRQNIYLAVQQQPGFVLDPDSPTFPCCGGSQNGNGKDVLVRVAAPTMPGTTVTPAAAPITDPGLLQFANDEATNVLAGNSGHVYFLARGDESKGHTATIGVVNKSDFTASTVDFIPSMPNVVPVGIAATDGHLVWIAANRAVGVGNGLLAPGCWIWHRNLVTNTTTMLFQTTNFSCMGTAVDDQFVYFAIVRSELPQDNCGGCTSPIHGDGIGRVSLADPANFQSVAFGTTGLGSGPRRVYLDPVSIYVVDPLVIGKLPKDFLIGRRHFTP